MPKVIDTPQHKIPPSLKFVFGGMSGMMAMCFVQPFELLKNRMQVTRGKADLLELFNKAVKDEGYRGLWTGLSAGVARQACFTTTRLGLYTVLFEKVQTPDGKPPSFAVKALLAMFTGMCGAIVGIPGGVALVRMTSDRVLPPEQRRNYNHVFDAWIRIVREEGPKTLFRGGVPAVGRAVVVNGIQLSTYSQVKQVLKENMALKEGLVLHFLASMTSGLATAVGSLPVDIMKTRYQSMKVIDGKAEYSNPLAVFTTVVKKEGVLALWKGFLPYYFKIGPQTVLVFIFLEKLNSIYLKYKYGEGSSGGGI